MENKLGCVCISVGHPDKSNNLAYTNYLVLNYVFKWFEFSILDNGDSTMFVDAFYRDLRMFLFIAVSFLDGPKSPTELSYNKAFSLNQLKPADTWQADHEVCFFLLLYGLASKLSSLYEGFLIL